MKRLATIFSLTILLCLSYTTMQAQNYATPGGIAYAADGDCSNPATPCNLGGAVEDATDGGANGSDIFVLLPAPNAMVSFNEDLVGAQRINGDVTFDTYTMPGPVTGVNGIAANDGDIIIGNSDIVTLAGNLEFQITGNNQVNFRASAEVVGPGFLTFTTGTQSLQLGDPSVGCPGASPKVGFIENMRVAGSSTVNVTDQCATDSESDLFITNQLTVDGTLNMNDNNLHLVAPTNNGIAGGVILNFGASITSDAFTRDIDGAGTLFISIDPAAIGGPPNTRAGAYVISGPGALNLPFDKNTDAGVKMDLTTIGGNSVNYNRAGALFVTTATTLNGTFRNEGGTRTEFDVLTSLTGNLEVAGPPVEVFPGSGVCGGGYENGVYFFQPVTVAGNLSLNNTDNPATAPCVEGVSFEAGSLVGNGTSTINGLFTADETTGVTLGESGGTTHNVAFQGNFAFDESPVFVLPSPATAKTAAASGNKVIFSGGSNQSLGYNTLLDIPSVAVMKDASGQTVQLNGSFDMLISNLLELYRGVFNTNGLLDGNGGGAGNGATVVVKRDGSGFGQMSRGAGTTAYLSNANSDIPKKVEYNGSLDIIAGDEIPGSNLTAVAPFEQLVVNMNSNNMVTLMRDIAVTDMLNVISGDLDLNGFMVDLGTTGTLSETAGNTVKGTAGVIKAMATLNAPAAANVGGLGAVITSGANLGSTEVIRGHAKQTGAGNESIERFYDINPTNNSGLNATLVSTYDESELDGAPEANLRLFRSTDGGTNWTNEGGTVNEGANTVTVTNVDAFSRWAVANNVNPLPVELTAFEAKQDGKQIILTWQTASETNNAGFEIQHAGLETEDWEALSFMDGAGTTTEAQTYTYHMAEVTPGTHRFRLRQVDLDGTFEYSTVVEVFVGPEGGFFLSPVYPNPFNPSTSFTLLLARDQHVRIGVYNALGQQVAQLHNGQLNAEREQIFRFDASGLPSGMYLIRVVGEGFVTTRAITLLR